MRKLSFLLTLILFSNCFYSQRSNNFETQKIEQIYWMNNNLGKILLDSIDFKFIKNELEKAKKFGFVKFIPEQKLQLLLKDNQTLTLFLNDGLVKVASKSDQTFKTNLNESYFHRVNKKYLFKNLSNQEIWERLIEQEGGCLSGNQYSFGNSHTRRDGVLKHNNHWRDFLNRPKYELTNFLIDKIDDTTQTKIHTCPFFNSTQGELAIYCLQQIHKISWFDFKEFHSFKDKETKGASDNPQSWILDILKNEKKRRILIKNWKKINKMASG